MAQVVLKSQHLPVQLLLLADSLPAGNHHSMSDLTTKANVTYLLAAKILEEIETHWGLNEVTVMERIEEEGKYFKEGICG